MTFDITAHLIDRCRERFLKDGDPLHVWAGYRLVRRKVVPTLGPGGLFSTMHVAPAKVPCNNPKCSRYREMILPEVDGLTKRCPQLRGDGERLEARAAVFA
jgi:hypothetical protein